MIGSALKIAGIAVVTVFFSLTALVCMPFDRRGGVYHHLARSWSRCLLAICGIRVRVLGHEHLEPGKSYVYVSNHASHFDIPALLAGIDDSIRILYKKELERIPIFGWQLKKSPFLVVDRARPRDGLQSIDNAVAAIREGSSVLVFPEGTRSRDGRLGSFKRGAFVLAARAGKPIVPVSVLDSHRILKAGSKRIASGTITLIIAPPVTDFGAGDKSAERALMDSIRSTIAEQVPAGTNAHV